MKRRLSRDDWLAHALRTLAAEGAPALRADRMAKALGVSRGSFYWHFRDLDDLNAAVLDLWRERTTEAVIADVDAAAPADRLARLMAGAMTAEASLERAVRAWASTTSAVAEVVDRVDRRRLAYLETLMAGGRDTRRARAAFVYWAYVGRVMSGVRSTPPGEAEIAKIAALFDRDEAPRSG